MADREGWVACLGEILIDQMVDPQGQRQNFPGGAPANVAVALTRLGVPTMFVGAVGDDSQGSELAEVLRTHGVDCQGLQVCDAPTRVVEVRCNGAGDRTFGGFIGGQTTAFADAQLTASPLAALPWSSVSALVTGTLGLASPVTQAAMQAAATAVQTQGGKLIIDVNWRPTFWPEPTLAIATIRPWLQQADLIKLAVDEAIALFQTNQIEGLATAFPNAQILLTDGERGCQYRFGDSLGEVPAFAVPAVETTGAGDAFLAGLVYQWRQQGWQWDEATQIARAVKFANAMGALTTLQPGAIAAQPSWAQLRDFLQTQTGEDGAIGTV